MFGAHVGESAQDLAAAGGDCGAGVVFGEAGDTEVEDAGAAGIVDEDVGGFEIAVDDAAEMGVRNGIADLEDEKAKATDSSNKFSKLENLLLEKKKDGPKIESKEGERNFCRDCMHFISHPFLTRCGLHKKNVEPMEDCDKFAAKPKGEL